MQRRTFLAVVEDVSTESVVGERSTYAWNSAIRATEDILRELGRTSVGALHGAPPDVLRVGEERIYRRIWTTNSGHEYRALVRETA